MAGSAKKKNKRNAGWWLKRLGLLVGSLLGFLLLLELVVRLVNPVPMPRELEPGLYQLSLPLVNGRPDGRWAGSPPENSAALSLSKEPGELRVVTFGESSMEGCPWGQMGSPAAFLKRKLSALLPDKKVTVINAGKTSSFMMDSYYYLVETLRYEPDYVIFYQGSNDRFDLDAEMCRVATSPGFHAFSRWLVEHSRLAWFVRAMGPEFYLSLVGSPDSEDFSYSPNQSDKPCDEDEAFAAWAEILVSTAREGGTTPIVVGFVQSDLEQQAGEIFRREEGTPTKLQRALLRCPLDPNCDAAKLFPATTEPRSFDAWIGGLDHKMTNKYDDEVGFRNDGWKKAAARHNAFFVDFTSLAKELPGNGAWVPPLFLDGVHLSMAGYAILGEQMAHAVAASYADEELPKEGFWRPSAELSVYYDAIQERTRDVVDQCDTLQEHADLYFEKGWQMFSGFMWRDALKLCPEEKVRPKLEKYRAYVEEMLGDGR